MAVTQTGTAFKTLSFNNTSSKTYGVYITGEAVYNAPERDIEMITIPGRNGAIAMDYGRFQNIEVTYPAGIFASSEADFRTAISDFRNFLCSKTTYVKLTDDYNPDEYRMALYKSGLEVDPTMLRAGEFNITFECKPQRFLTSGDTVTTMTASGSISNPTNFDSKPLLVVTGTGTLTVNGVQITFTASPTTVDCEAMEAYNGTTSRNGSITLSPNRFPVLSPGSNTITKGSGISQVKITPRWWRV